MEVLIRNLKNIKKCFNVLIRYIVNVYYLLISTVHSYHMDTLRDLSDLLANKYISQFQCQCKFKNVKKTIKIQKHFDMARVDLIHVLTK